MECKSHDLTAPVVLALIFFYIYTLGFVKKLGLGSQSNVKQKIGQTSQPYVVSLQLLLGDRIAAPFHRLGPLFGLVVKNWEYPQDPGC